MFAVYKNAGREIDNAWKRTNAINARVLFIVTREPMWDNTSQHNWSMIRLFAVRHDNVNPLFPGRL